jgi:L-fucose mutarotase
VVTVVVCYFVLSYELTHPDVLAALARAGHGAQVLISDGHFPHSTGAAPSATRIYLNLAPGTVDATTILRAVATAITIESAALMGSDGGPVPEAHADLRSALPPHIRVQTLGRWEFYDACKKDSVAVAIASGDIRLTIGVGPVPAS